MGTSVLSILLFCMGLKLRREECNIIIFGIRHCTNAQLVTFFCSKYNTLVFKNLPRLTALLSI